MFDHELLREIYKDGCKLKFKYVKYWIVMVGSFILFYLGLFYGLALLNDDKTIRGWIVLIMAFVLIVTASKKFMRYKDFRKSVGYPSDRFKSEIFIKILEAKFDDLKYSLGKSDMDQVYLKPISAIYTCDRIRGNDHFWAKHNGVPFEYMDIVTQKCVKVRTIPYFHRGVYMPSMSSELFITKYKGPLIMFGNNKKFRWDLILVQKRFKTAITRPGWLLNFGSNRRRIKFDNASFNSKFKVYAVDEEETFSLIKPHIADKLVAFAKKNRENLVVLFSSDSVYITINNRKNAFEPSFITLWHFKKSVDAISKQLDIITDLVEVFGLDTNFEPERA